MAFSQTIRTKSDKDSEGKKYNEFVTVTVHADGEKTAATLIAEDSWSSTVIRFESADKMLQVATALFNAAIEVEDNA